MKSRKDESVTRMLASVLYVLAAIVFVISGAGILTRAEWMRPVLVGSAIFSSATILLLWDGSLQLVVNKGLIGLLISLAVLAALLLKW